MLNEVWITTIEDERYEVNNLGIVRNKQSKKIIKSFDNGHGYLAVAFWINNNTFRKKFYVHRLVANAFIPHFGVDKEVNHKDGNRQNNNSDNLEWVTRTENLTHKFDVLGNHQWNEKKVKCIETGKIYNSINSASRDTSISRYRINQSCNNQFYNSANGFHWSFV